VPAPARNWLLAMPPERLTRKPAKEVTSGAISRMPTKVVQAQTRHSVSMGMGWGRAQLQSTMAMLAPSADVSNAPSSKPA
jgi:hypothetical protein